MSQLPLSTSSTFETPSVGTPSYSGAERDRRAFLAAVARLKEITQADGVVSKARLLEGFQFEGERIQFINRYQGIFKPKSMGCVLSILTQYATRDAWYDDQLQVHEQIRSGAELVDYSFTGKNPNDYRNQALLRAKDEQTPLIYFLGVAPQLFLPIYPCFVYEWDPNNLEIKVGFGARETALATGQGSSVLLAADASERRYAMQEVKVRLHQTGFRQKLLAAYESRCAISGLPEPMLLDAAHIVSDKDEKLGQPVVPNGLLLSKIHHTAFDANLIGISPDFKVFVSPQLMEQKDGPLLEAIKSFHGATLRLPARKLDRPDRERLEARWAEFER